jgi:hypothetical protein
VRGTFFACFGSQPSPVRIPSSFPTAGGKSSKRSTPRMVRTVRSPRIGPRPCARRPETADNPCTNLAHRTVWQPLRPPEESAGAKCQAIKSWLSTGRRLPRGGGQPCADDGRVRSRDAGGRNPKGS